MIRSFRHRGLRALYRGQEQHRLNPDHLRKLINILGVLDQSVSLREVNVTAYKLHQLSGDMKGHYSVTVSGNWRVTFRFEDGDAYDVDYIDYH